MLFLCLILSVKYFSRFYEIFNILSLDVALGATFTSYFICIWMGVDPSIQLLFLLFNTVWLIYILDHLVDVKSEKRKRITKRKEFFKKYKYIVGLILLALVLVEIALIYFNVEIVFYAWPAILITVLYLILNWLNQSIKRMFYLKELFIALGYVLGVMAIPFYMAGDNEYDLKMLMIPLSFYFLTALNNVLILAWYEKETDIIEGQTSIALWVSKSKLKLIMIVILIVQAFLSVIFHPILTFGIVIIYGMLVFKPQYFIRNERFRKYADGVFLISGFVLLLM